MGQPADQSIRLHRSQTKTHHQRRPAEGRVTDRRGEQWPTSNFDFMIPPQQALWEFQNGELDRDEYTKNVSSVIRNDVSV